MKNKRLGAHFLLRWSRRWLVINVRNLWFLFPLTLVLLLSSCHIKVIKWHLYCIMVLGEMIIIWVEYGNVFNQRRMFSLKKVDNLRAREQEREEKEPKNPANKALIPPLMTPEYFQEPIKQVRPTKWVGWIFHVNFLTCLLGEKEARRPTPKWNTRFFLAFSTRA